MAAVLAQHEANKAAMGEIDNGLDALVGITGQMSENATAIGNELDDQIQMCKETNEHMDQTNENIDKATDKLVALQKTGGSAITSYIVMAILIILILLSVFDVIPWKKLRG